jgi:putative addiction module CopG family antidote
MSSIEKVSIALSSEMLAVVRKAVAGGDYSSTSEVVREALREWKQRRPVVTQPVALVVPGTPLLPLSAAIRTEIRRLCRQFAVRRLAVFGSALGADFSSANDVDLAVEFGEAAPHSLVDQYLGFKSRMEQLFAKPVDLLELAAMPDSRLKRHIQQTARDIHVESQAA